MGIEETYSALGLRISAGAEYHHIIGGAWHNEWWWENLLSPAIDLVGGWISRFYLGIDITPTIKGCALYIIGQMTNDIELKKKGFVDFVKADNEKFWRITELGRKEIR